MGTLDSILEPVGKAMVFESIRPGLRSYVMKAGYSEVPYRMFGMVFYLIAASFTVVFTTVILPRVQADSVFLTFIYAFLAAMGILVLIAAIVIMFIHFIFSMKIYSRTKELERILPDYLTLVSTNLKGGMPFERALWDAIKPEFGVLANEIGLVSKKVMTGNEIAAALNEFVQKYESPILRRNFQLIIGEFEAGGEIVVVIDRIIVNLKKTQILKKELVASTVTYMIFISALVVFISPSLFALSFQLFFLIQSFMGQIDGAGGASGVGSIQLAAPDVAAGDFRLFSVLAIIVIAAGSSFITSVIEKGDFSAVPKYAPLYIVVAVAVYFVSSALLSGVFSGLTLS